MARTRRNRGRRLPEDERREAGAAFPASRAGAARAELQALPARLGRHLPGAGGPRRPARRADARAAIERRRLIQLEGLEHALVVEHRPPDLVRGLVLAHAEAERGAGPEVE